MKRKFKFLIIALLSIMFSINATACEKCKCEKQHVSSNKFEKEQEQSDNEDGATGTIIFYGAFAALVIGCIFAGSFDD